MVSTYAQKQASKNYVERLKNKGISQHCLYCTPLQWIVLKEIIRQVKIMNLDGLQSIEVDDNGQFIRFIYAPETRVVSPNQDEDD